MRTALTIAFCIAIPSLRGQGTIQFGFEEFPVDSTPPFVSVYKPTPWRSSANVADAANSYGIPPFEGPKFLLGVGGLHLASPDGQLIQSFTLRVFGTGPNEGTARPIFYVADQPVLQYGSWQTVQGSFAFPVPSFAIRDFVSSEVFPVGFGIDSVQFVTIPEPRTLWLLAFCPILFAGKLRNRKANAR